MPRPRSAEDEAFETIEAWWRAWIENDASAIESLTDPGYFELSEARTFQQPGTAPTPETKATPEYSERIEITSWHIDAPATKAFSGTVVCTYSFFIHGTRNGHPFAYEGFATDVLRRRGNRWTYISHHTTLVVSQQAPDTISTSSSENDD
jgi:ketosteroid isomerase-like protein